MLPVLQFFGLTLPVGPLFALLAFYIGGELGSRAMGWFGDHEHSVRWRDAFSNATFVALVAGLLAARLGYAFVYFRLYLAEPQLLFSLRPGTLALVPGLLVGALAALFYLHRRGVPLIRTGDAAAVGVAAALAMLSIGNFLTGDAYGLPTDVPWAVEMWNALRHPVQIYTAAALVVVVAVLWWQRKGAAPGQTFWRFIMFYGLSELLVSTFRANPRTWGPGIRVSQVAALTALLVAMLVLSYYAQAGVSTPTDQNQTPGQAEHNPHAATG